MLNTSCQAPYPPITKSQALKKEVTKQKSEDVPANQNPEVKTSGHLLEKQTPLRLEFEESITVIGEEQKFDFSKEMFLLDYQAIKSIYSDDPNMRLELSFFREALVKIMETEFSLVLISGHTSFERISSEITQPYFYRIGRGIYTSPYRGVRRYHNHLQQALNQSSSSDVRKRMTAILMATAIEFFLIEKREEKIKEEISKMEEKISKAEEETSKAENEATLQSLLKQREQLLQAKNQTFANQPWTMILFEEIEDHKENLLPLKEILMTIYRNHSSLIESQLNGDSIEIASNAEQLSDHIYTDLQPPIIQAATQLLERIPYRVHRYRSDRTALFAHDVIQQQTLKYLKDVQDDDASDAYDEWTNQTNAHPTTDIAIAAGAIFICRAGAGVAIPIAALFSIADALNQMSFKQALLRDAIFGLNSYLQYDSYNNAGLLEFLLSVGTAALMCSTKSPPLNMSHLPRNIRSFSNIKLGSQQILAKVKETLFDINALPAAMASLVALYAIERFEKCDEIWDIQACHEMWDQEFTLLFVTTFIAEFIFVFKSLGKWTFFSMEHIKVMQNVARTIFGISLSTQAILNVINDENFNDINYRLASFEVAFSALISLTTTKLVLLYMVDPFSNWLEVRTALIGRKTANFSLMFFKNILGNGLYLIGGHYFSEEEEEENKNE